MNIIVCGGDGFCGWPTALHLSNLGHRIIIVDNLSRRKIDGELSTASLTPISSIQERINAWHEVSGSKIEFVELTLGQDYDELVSLIVKEQPDAIVHLGEQRAAPYSMKSAAQKRYTVSNNLNATHDILAALVETGVDAHVVHLGTMGVYGYGTNGMKIPEGYLKVAVETPTGPVEQEILYPANPGSIYHMTKTQDALFFHFYAKNDKLRITDLHQGVVWGTQTKETKLDDRLINRFDYDGDYGTVLNRFLMQSAIKHPLTVHGEGGQTRAFIHIQDTVLCIELAIKNPPKAGDRVNILNQMTETHRVRDLATMISDMTGAEVVHLPNPRNEAGENELHVHNDRFLGMGLQPTTLSKGLMEEVTQIALRFKDRADSSKIISNSYWTKTRKKAAQN